MYSKLNCWQCPCKDQYNHNLASSLLTFNTLVLWLIYIAGDELGYGLGLEFLSCTEIESMDPNQESVQCEMFCIVQCSH